MMSILYVAKWQLSFPLPDPDIIGSTESYMIVLTLIPSYIHT